MQRLEAGAAFGPYTIEGFVAGGGMGEVYAARHAVYGSPVALKVLHVGLHADDGWRRRFNEEGLVGQQLKHPHVLAARELVEHDGRIALIMDLARGGQTLARVITREFATGLSLVQGLQVFLGLLQGVEYLHTKEIVHGDIKPENVLVQGDIREPGSWVPLVTDFGTVGLVAHPVLIDGQPAVVASPRYASPEHLLGVDRIEVRSDIYSLGLLLHFLLTGRHASDARDVLEAAHHVVRPIPLVHMVDQPESVIQLVQKATAVRPEHRYASCREMALAIRAVLDELGVKLELEDLQADLATEVIEERLRMRLEAAEQDEIEDQETELDVVDSSAEVVMQGKDDEASGPPEPPAEARAESMPTEPPAEGRLGALSTQPPLGPPPKRDAPAAVDEPGPEGFQNPLWGAMADDDEMDLSEAPTARLSTSDREPPEEATLEELAEMARTPRPARADEDDLHHAPTVILGGPDPVPALAPAAGVPWWVWVAAGAGLAVIALVMGLLYTG